MAMTLLTTNTPSGAANSAFTSSIDSTYKLYIFKFYDVNPATDDVSYTFNGSDDASSWSYDIIKTTTFFNGGYHAENDSNAGQNYSAGSDIAQGTGYQPISTGVGNDADSSVAGTLWLFNPSNTTYVKHFYTRANNYSEANGSYDSFAAGYFNTTAAITAIDFKMTSGNMDGTIKMYGVG
jgi:hypothetical protein